jgi:hypothetical protein
MNYRSKVIPLWLMVGTLLLAFALTTPKLNYDALSYDEVRAYIVAGGAHHGPLQFPSGVWERVTEQSPDQAMGFSLVIWLWGTLVGWSEVAARTLPMLAGILTIAMTYRIGRDLFNRFVGVSAALVLASSIFFITFMHKFRVFTLAALAVSVAMWCYWRLVYADKPGWWASLGLTLSGIALFYTHYYVTPFIAVLGLYHLIFAPKNRRWWLPVLLLLPALLIFLPELSILSTGFTNNLNNERVSSRALSPVGIGFTLVKYFSNDFAWLFVILLVVALVASFMPLSTNVPHQRRHLRYLWWCAVSMFVMVILLNAFSQVFVVSRVRYLMGVWVPLALVVGLALWRLRDVSQPLAVGLLALWVVFGVYRTLEDELMWIGRGDQILVHPWRELADAVFRYGEPDDALIFQGKWYPQFGHYTHGIPIRWDIRPYHGAEEMREATAANYKRIWWGVNEDIHIDENLALMASILDEKGYIYCQNYLDDPLLSLNLYVRSSAFCPGGEPLYTFGEFFTLTQVDYVKDTGTLWLYTGWETSSATPPNTYSVAFHMFDNRDDLVAQGDVGFGTADGPYTAMEVSLDVRTLPRVLTRSN